MYDIYTSHAHTSRRAIDYAPIVGNKDFAHEINIEFSRWCITSLLEKKEGKTENQTVSKNCDGGKWDTRGEWYIYKWREGEVGSEEKSVKRRAFPLYVYIIID